MDTTIEKSGHITIELWNKQPIDALFINTVRNNEDARLRLCQQLQLDAQVSLIQAKHIPYRMMTKEHCEIWKNFLPATYSSAYGSWRSYRFDTIPLPVLEKMVEAQGSGYFRELQIWTPEEAQVDPLCVGVDDLSNYYPIARWGESLLPFEKIRRLVTKKQGRQDIAAYVTMGIFVSLCVLSLIV